MVIYRWINVRSVGLNTLFFPKPFRIRSYKTIRSSFNISPLKSRSIDFKSDHVSALSPLDSVLTGSAPASRLESVLTKIGGDRVLRNAHDTMLAQRFAAGKLLQLLQAFHSPARQERQQAQLAGLQILVGVEQVLEKVLVLGKQPGLFVQGPPGLALQVLELKADFVPRRLDCALERRVELLNLLAEFFQHGFDLHPVLLEAARQRLRNRNRLHLPAQFLRTSPQVLDAQSILLQQF